MWTKLNQPVNYDTRPIEFVKRLIRIQKGISAKTRFVRTDQALVDKCISHLRPLVENNRYNKSQAYRFWQNYRWQIRTIIPGRRYPGFTKLIREFEDIDQTELWRSLSDALK